MNYYYDLLLNFQEDYWMFYEWDSKDNFDFVKKIPLFHISSETYLDFLTKKVIVSKDFLNQIENKTKLKQNETLLYTSVFSDGKNNIALEFNKEGLVINKSSLTLDDELNINEFMYSIKESKIDYSIKCKEIFKKETRQELKVKKVLKLEINSMYKKCEYSKIKYIYLEWFNELSSDIEMMYNKMMKRLENNLDSNAYKIYELIKISYNNV